MEICAGNFAAASILDAIDPVLGIHQKKDIALRESYVVEPKVFDLRTELLGSRTKKIRQLEFESGIKAVNTVSVKLDTAAREESNSLHSDIRSLKKDEIYNLSLSFLKAAHLKNISSLKSVITADSISFMRLERDFGSFADWQRDFIACAMGSRNGFAVVAYSIPLRRYMNFLVDNESPTLPTDSIYVIVLDVAEGAFYRDFGNDRKLYVSSMMKEFDWEEIEDRFRKAEKIARIFQ